MRRPPLSRSWVPISTSKSPGSSPSTQCAAVSTQRGRNHRSAAKLEKIPFTAARTRLHERRLPGPRPGPGGLASDDARESLRGGAGRRSRPRAPALRTPAAQPPPPMRSMPPGAPPAPAWDPTAAVLPASSVLAPMLTSLPIQPSERGAEKPSGSERGAWQVSSRRGKEALDPGPPVLGPGRGEGEQLRAARPAAGAPVEPAPSSALSASSELRADIATMWSAPNGGVTLSASRNARSVATGRRIRGQGIEIVDDSVPGQSKAG